MARSLLWWWILPAPPRPVLKAELPLEVLEVDDGAYGGRRDEEGVALEMDGSGWWVVVVLSLVLALEGIAVDLTTLPAPPRAVCMYGAVGLGCGLVTV